MAGFWLLNRATVAGKPSSDLAISTELSILKQADLRRDDS